MHRFGRILLALSLVSIPPARALPASERAIAQADLPKALSREGFASLLQRFVDQSYLKGFRNLGDERDFDHGHVLFDGAGKPLAILYHTQELALGQPRGSDFAYLDPGARNWIQWIEDGRVENAARYERREYPRTATWDWFRATELPGLVAHHTILDKMLDPTRLPIDVAKTKQWVFTRVPCGDSPPSSSKELRILLPTNEAVCLSLSVS